LPVQSESDSTDLIFWWYAPNSLSGSNTVTCNGSGGLTNYSIALWEYRGLSTTAPLGNATDFLSAALIGSTILPGTVQSNSTSVLFVVGGLMSNTSATFTASAGLAPIASWGNALSFQQWDETVSSGSYSPVITPSASSYWPQGFALVLESAPVVVPVLKQHARGSGVAGGDGVNSATLPGSVHVGDLLIDVVTNQSTSVGPGTLSDSQSNTYTLITGGTSSDKLSVYFAVANATGALTITDTMSQCVNVSDFGVLSSPTLDQSNYQSNYSGGTSESDGGITTSVANELLVSTGYVDSESYRLYLQSINAGQGWSGEIFACGAHDASGWLAWRPQVSAGSYGNTWTFTQSMPIAAAIASFKFPTSGGSNGGPHVQILSKLEYGQYWSLTR
jgi:hypothetical protein